MTSGIGPFRHRSIGIKLATLGVLTFAVAACGTSSSATVGNSAPTAQAATGIATGSVPSSVITAPGATPTGAASGGCPPTSLIAQAIGVSPADLGGAPPGPNADGTELCTYVGLHGSVQVFYGPPTVNSYFMQSCQTNNANNGQSCAWAQAGQRSYLVNALGLPVPARTILNAILQG
jgi:hypothetical protein